MTNTHKGVVAPVHRPRRGAARRAHSQSVEREHEQLRVARGKGVADVCRVESARCNWIEAITEGRARKIYTRVNPRVK